MVQLGHVYEILKLFCLQVIEDWFCIFNFLIWLVGLCVESLDQCDVVNIG